ncbi:hypothetical protein N7509_004097 [Penicillium cosmopolitanum]|uniref:FAS1 domain-containing protein n=1 Tax=Penicillium cosmopolitanum TaxID=1131564 RepID=A0A9W9W6I9_9EURO|nr:uncharacterized protein N7509_004097 [Penicillium cosmopolitanum]KAJ5404226.1 hypothetical protein N7509_004097 [Penicillium cosmopolitanum]
MRATDLISSLVILFTFISSSTALWTFALPNSLRQRPLVLQNQDQDNHQHPHGSKPIMDRLIPGILKPQPGPQPNIGGEADEPIISDVLPKTKGINIFAQLTRDFDSISQRLNDASKNLTVLAPRNSAVQDLPRKPWEDPEDYAKFGEVNAYEGQDGKDRARDNLRRFVEAHLIPVSPWVEGEEVETLGGVKLKWVKEGDKIKIQPGDIEVDKVAEKVANGEVWVLNKVINYSR